MLRRKKMASKRSPAKSAKSSGSRLRQILHSVGWPLVLAPFFLAAVTISNGSADTTSDRMILPVEVLGAAGETVSRSIALLPAQAESVQSLWLQMHGLRYADQGSVQVNTGDWIPLNNNTVAIAEPGRSFGGIGGGFSTLVMTLPLPRGTLIGGANTIRFRFNQTDGFTSAYRVLAWNFLTADGKKLIPPSEFVEDAPETFHPDRAGTVAHRLTCSKQSPQ
jgi:hypothetical protein